MSEDAAPEPKKRGRPKQNSLPGMESRAIESLNDAAYDYAKVRDKRMELSTEEHELKTKLLGLMKKHKKKEYIYEDVEIRVVTEEETVKVRIIKKADKEDE